MFIIGHDFSYYVSSLPAHARPHLELILDHSHEGVEKDLYEIAKHMLNWEEMSSYLELTAGDVSDTRNRYPEKPSQQR